MYTCGLGWGKPLEIDRKSVQSPSLPRPNCVSSVWEYLERLSESSRTFSGAVIKRICCISGGGGEEAMLRFNGFCRLWPKRFLRRTLQHADFSNLSYPVHVYCSYSYLKPLMTQLSLRKPPWVVFLGRKLIRKLLKSAFLCGWCESCPRWGNTGSGGQRAWDLLVTHYSTPEIKDLFALLYHLFLYSNRTVLLGTFRHIWGCLSDYLQ